MLVTFDITKAALVFYRKLRTLGMPQDKAVKCAHESIAWAGIPRYRDCSEKMFNLCRALYCLDRWQRGRRAPRRKI